MRAADEASIAGFVDAIQEVTCRIMFGDTPVVAAVRGWAVGGAFSWPVNCDFSVWSDDALGFFPELKIGLYPSGAITFLLPLQVGPARAREMLYTSRKYAADELLACGLANEVVPGDRLLDTAVARAQALAALPPQARRALKRGARRAAPRRDRGGAGSRGGGSDRDHAGPGHLRAGSSANRSGDGRSPPGLRGKGYIPPDAGPSAILANGESLDRNIDKYTRLVKRPNLEKGQFVVCATGLDEKRIRGFNSMYGVTFANETNVLEHARRIAT